METTKKTVFIYEKPPRCKDCGFSTPCKDVPELFMHCKLLDVDVVSFSVCIDFKKLKSMIWNK